MFAKRTNWNLQENRLSQALAEHRASGRALLDLTASNPTECSFVYDGEAILRALGNPQALHYQPNARGLIEAREAGREYYSSNAVGASPVTAEDIFLLASTSEAYSFVFRMMCNAGDEMLVPAPSYPLFSFLAEIQDVRLAPYRLIYDHGWQIDFDALTQAITPQTKGIVVVHPNNPTGHFCKSGEMKELDSLCARNGMALVADEVFLDCALEKM